MAKTLADALRMIDREQKIARTFNLRPDVMLAAEGPQHRCGGAVWVYKVTSLVNGTHAVFAKCVSCGRTDRANIEVEEGYTLDDIVQAHEIEHAHI